MRLLPVVYRWNQALHVMAAEQRYWKVCDRQFSDSEEYPLVVLEARSRASHNQYFAAVADGFANLPEGISARWPTAEHLRKWCLVETGWFEEKEFQCDTEGNAYALATFIRTEASFARISVHGSKVIVRRAKSQSAAEMGKDDFQASKQAVLELIEYMIGAERGSLRKQAGKSA